MRFAKVERQEKSSRAKTGPSISSGLMKKLEPVLQMKKRVIHCHTIPTAVQPLNDGKGDKCKHQDAYCFSSSSTEDVAKKKTKDELKKEKQVCKTRAKNLKRYAKKEVLEVIRNTRESIQFLRSQLYTTENKDSEESEWITSGTRCVQDVQWIS